MTHPHFPYPVRLKDDDAELFLIEGDTTQVKPWSFPVGTTFLVDSVERSDPTVGIFGDDEYILEREGRFYSYVGHDFFDDGDADDDGRPVYFPGKFEFVPVYCPGTEIPLEDHGGPQGCAVCGETRINYRVDGDETYFVTHDADPGLVALYLRRQAQRSS